MIQLDWRIKRSNRKPVETNGQCNEVTDHVFKYNYVTDKCPSFDFILEMCNRTTGHVSFASSRPGRYYGSVSLLSAPSLSLATSNSSLEAWSRAHAGIPTHNFQPRYSILPAMHSRHYCFRRTLLARTHIIAVITTGERVSCPEPP